jgi:hypothetical protein
MQGGGGRFLPNRAGFTDELRIDTTRKQAAEVVQEILATIVG